MTAKGATLKEARANAYAATEWIIPSRTNTCVMTLAKQSMKRKTGQDTEGVADEKKTVQRISKCKDFLGNACIGACAGSRTFSENLAFVSHAESAAKVTASSAKIRKSADSSSEVIGSAARIRPFPSRARPREQMAIPGMRYMWMRIRWDIFVPIW